MEKREKKGRLSVQIEPLASLAAQPLCFRENGSLAFDNKKNTEGRKKNTIFFRRCSLPQLLHERNRKKAVKFWPGLLLCVCINIQFLCFHPEEVKHRGRVMA